MVKIFIWVAVAGVVFAVLWRKGQLERFANYMRSTREELKRCTWPTLAELQGSTVVIFVSIVLLGGFTVGVDFVINLLLQLIT
ncbi:MAG: preprotein translocase subunit SecE [Verrucomicrobia bacterium]|nr:preprotein translocase subunit SecE [Verrucomicrobiota bacterium]